MRLLNMWDCLIVKVCGAVCCVCMCVCLDRQWYIKSEMLISAKLHRPIMYFQNAMDAGQMNKNDRGQITTSAAWCKELCRMVMWISPARTKEL